MTYRGAPLGRRGSVERGGRGQIQVDDHGFQCRAPAFVIGPLRVRSDLVHQSAAERVPRQVEFVDQRNGDCQCARLPGCVKDARISEHYDQRR